MYVGVFLNAYMKHVQHTLIVIGIAMCFFVSSLSADALTNTLTIGPTSFILKVKPGEKKSFPVFIENSSEEPILLTSSLGLFEGKLGDESGAVDTFNADEGSPATWVTFPKKSFQLAGKEQRTIPVTISTPKNIAGGGYNVLIRWHSRPLVEKKNSVHIRQVIQTVLIIDVAGPQRIEKAELVTFSTGDSPFIFNKKSVSFLIRVKNLGNVPIKPVGDIQIKNILGQTVGILPLNQDGLDAGGYVPQQNGIRMYAVDWQKKFSFGKYTAILRASYGEHGSILSNAIDIWVLPLPLLTLLVLIVLALCIFLLYIIGTYVLSMIRRT